MSSRSLRIGTRGSKLARWQSAHVASALEAAHPGLTVEECVLKTEGDALQETPEPDLLARKTRREANERPLHHLRGDNRIGTHKGR